MLLSRRTAPVWTRLFRTATDSTANKRIVGPVVTASQVVVHGGHGRSGLRCFGCGAVIHRGIGATHAYTGMGTGTQKIGSVAPDPNEVCERCRMLRRGDILGALRATEDVDPAVFVNELRTLQTRHMLVIMVVDAIEFETTFLKFIRRFVGRNPILLAVTKVDLIADAGDEAQRNMLRDYFKRRAADIGLTVKDAIPVCGLTGDGMMSIFDTIVESYLRQNIYVIGAANVGKSTLVNALKDILLDNLPFRNREGHMRKDAARALNVTSSPLPGTTLRLTRIPCLPDSRVALYDTPGVLVDSFRFPHVKQKLGSPKRPKAKTTRMLQGQTLVIGRDLVHVDIGGFSGRMPSPAFMTRWYSLVEDKLQVIGRKDSRRRQLDIRNKYGNAEDVSMRLSPPGVQIYGDDSSDTAYDDEDIHPYGETPGTPALHLDKPQPTSSEATRIIPHELLAEYNILLNESKSNFLYACDLAISNLGFLSIKSQEMLYVRVYGPPQLQIYFRPCLPIVEGNDADVGGEKLSRAQQIADMEDIGNDFEDEHLFERLSARHERDMARKDYYTRSRGSGERRGEFSRSGDQPNREGRY